MKNTLWVTVGIPQSGKSTWAKTQQVPIVNPDSIRLALHGKPFIGLAEPFVWAIAKVMVRALFIAGHEEVILDATNTTQKRRVEWKSKSWDTEFKVFEADFETCVKRAKNTCVDNIHFNNLVLAMERMRDNFEPVTEEERRSFINE